MRNIVKKTLILHFVTFNMLMSCHAFDLDTSVDDEIRKNYNPDKLVKEAGCDESLPALPNITKYNMPTAKSDVVGTEIKPPPVKIAPYRGGNVRIKSGTTFNVSSVSKISDWQIRGTKVQFKTAYPINKSNYKLPAGTIFNGEIIESHQPQITCNGGLVAIKLNSLKYNNQYIPINGYVIRANDKKIFFNNIKGKRTYLKTMYKKGDWGRTMFKKMITLTVNLGSDGSTLILTPFPFLYGSICLGANAITSPITAFFSKGGHVSIPAGSPFKIKLTEDTYIN